MSGRTTPAEEFDSPTGHQDHHLPEETAMNSTARTAASRSALLVEATGLADMAQRAIARGDERAAAWALAEGRKVMGRLS